MLGRGLDPCPGRASVGVDPVLHVWCTIALGGPGVCGWAGQVPNAALGDGVGDREEGVVDSAAVRFGSDEDEGAWEVDPVESGRTEVGVVAYERPQSVKCEGAMLQWEGGRVK